jgi:hypothetical protein
MTGRFLDREGALILGLGLLALTFLALGGYFLFNPPGQPQVERPGYGPIQDSLNASPAYLSADTPAAVRAPRELTMAGEDGWTVLDLLAQTHTVVVDTELLLFGSIVLAIDSVHAESDEYWIYYRDTIPGDRPPEACTTRTGETIRWVLKRRR